MSTGSSIQVTLEEIERVKDLIERCILNYMKKKDIIVFLYQQHNIEPCFTRIVWQHLEEQNQHLFWNYKLRLAVKDQLTRFNNLHEIQAPMIKQLYPNAVTAFPPIQPVPFDLPPNGLNNGGLLGSQHSSDHHFNSSLGQNPNAAMLQQGMNNGIPVNNEPGDLGNLASVPSTSNMDSNSHQLQRTFTDDLSAFLVPRPNSLFDSNGITEDNQDPNMQLLAGWSQGS